MLPVLVTLVFLLLAFGWLAASMRAGSISHLHREVVLFRNDVERDWRGLLSIPKPAAPTPFVAVLCIGTRVPMGGRTYDIHDSRPEGTVISLGCAGPAGSKLELITQVPLHDVQVIVFTDLSRVDVRAIVCGADLVTASYGVCPLAFFPRWEPGVKVAVQTEARPCS
jgi:hypothetical protein